MKHVIAYTVFANPDAIEWLLQGIAENVVAADAEIWFQFDWHCKAAYFRLIELMDLYSPFRFKIGMAGEKRIDVTTIGSHKRKTVISEVADDAPELREVGCHNALLKLFLAESEADFLTVWQDDQRMTGPITAHIDAVHAVCGERLGIIGGRDGFELGEQDRTSSPWSDAGHEELLSLGEFREKPYLNSGPIIYPRTTVQRVGVLDDGFIATNVWADYGHRCRAHGLTNVVMGTSCRHEKMGKWAQSRYTRADSDADDARAIAKIPGWTL